MTLCPHCGKPMNEPTAEAERLLALLTHSTPHRQVYRGRDGSWYLTYGGGPFSESAVRWLLKQKKIQCVYSSLPDDAYHVGRTWDCERTLAARKKLGKSAPDYYVGDPPETNSGNAA